MVPDSSISLVPTPASSWVDIYGLTCWPTPTPTTLVTCRGLGAKNRFTNGYTWRSREDLNIDTRTATEYGVVRTFFDATFTWTTDSYAGNAAAPGSTVYSPVGGGTVASVPTVATLLPAGTSLQISPASA